MVVRVVGRERHLDELVGLGALVIRHRLVGGVGHHEPGARRGIGLHDHLQHFRRPCADHDLVLGDLMGRGQLRHKLALLVRRIAVGEHDGLHQRILGGRRNAQRVLVGVEAHRPVAQTPPRSTDKSCKGAPESPERTGARYSARDRSGPDEEVASTHVQPPGKRVGRAKTVRKSRNMSDSVAMLSEIFVSSAWGDSVSLHHTNMVGEAVQRQRKAADAVETPVFRHQLVSGSGSRRPVIAHLVNRQRYVAACHHLDGFSRFPRPLARSSQRARRLSGVPASHRHTRFGQP